MGDDDVVMSITFSPFDESGDRFIHWACFEKKHPEFGP